MNHIPNSNNLLLSPTSEIPDIKPITIPKEKLEEILKDLEYKVNPKSSKEGLNLIDTNKTMAPMIAGSKEFENKVGRRMTYGEIRETWG
jgi:hypothetical protein